MFAGYLFLRFKDGHEIGQIQCKYSTPEIRHSPLSEPRAFLDDKTLHIDPKLFQLRLLPPQN